MRLVALFGGLTQDTPSTNIDDFPTEQHSRCLGPPNGINDDLAYLVNV